jgi:hypothetical protein
MRAQSRKRHLVLAREGLSGMVLMILDVFSLFNINMIITLGCLLIISRRHAIGVEG